MRASALADPVRTRESALRCGGPAKGNLVRLDVESYFDYGGHLISYKVTFSFASDMGTGRDMNTAVLEKRLVELGARPEFAAWLGSPGPSYDGMLVMYAPDSPWKVEVYFLG